MDTRLSYWNTPLRRGALGLLHAAAAQVDHYAKAPPGVNMCHDDLPRLSPAPTAWIMTGHYGTPQHVDKSDRWSVLLVCEGESGWYIASGTETYVPALADELILLDTHTPHSLWHVNGRARRRWLALAWDYRTKPAAVRQFERLRKRYG